MNGPRVPLSGSVNGRPIVIDDTVPTVIQTAPANGSVTVSLDGVNTKNGGTTRLTIDIAGFIEVIEIAANDVREVAFTISNGEQVRAIADALGMIVLGVAEHDPVHTS